MSLKLPFWCIPQDFIGAIFLIIWLQYFLISIMISNYNLSLFGHIYHLIQVVVLNVPTLSGVFLFSLGYYFLT